MGLLSDLRQDDKKGLFKRTQTSVGYPTSFLPFDYKNGYKIEVKNMKDEVVTTYPSIGFVGGTFNTVIGKTGVAKTTFIIQSAYAMIKDIENAFIVHYDLEQALNYTRIRDLLHVSNTELEEKYILKQEKNYLEDITDAILEIVRKKKAGGDKYKYDTGLLNEFAEPIKIYVPTIVVIDSIPQLTSRTSGELDGNITGEQILGTGTDKMRKVGLLTSFYDKLIPIIKQYNITLVAINHIKNKIDINPFVKTASQIMYLKQNETIPGGEALLYYANNIIKFVKTDLLKEEKDGFDGFIVRLELIKSRTNKAGQYCELVYSQKHGFDKLLSLYRVAENAGKVLGRNPYRYFEGFSDIKFDSRDLHGAVAEHPELTKILFKVAIPILEEGLTSDEPSGDLELDEIYKRIIESEIIADEIVSEEVKALEAEQEVKKPKTKRTKKSTKTSSETIDDISELDNI